MAVLLNCVVCGGKVSSDASSCPHCGTRSFMSDEYIQKVSREIWEKQEREMIIREEELGERVCIIAKERGIFGTFGTATKQYISFYIDDIDLSEYEDIASTLDDYCMYRLKRGAHTVKLISKYRKTYITTLPFTYNGESTIEIVYKGGNNGLFRDNIRYWLVDVKCKWENP